MPIHRIRIKDYRSLHSVDIEPGRVTVITGPAGTGKTSIVEAILYALTGRNQWTDDRGAGVKTQVSLGAKKAEVQVDWQDAQGEVHEFARAIPPPAGVKALQDRIDGVLEVPPDVVAAQLSTRRFLSMPVKEQEDLLQGLLSPPLTVDRWAVEMNAWDEDLPDLGTWFSPRFEKIPMKKTLVEYAEIERCAAKKLRTDLVNEVRVKESTAKPERVTQERVDALRTEWQEMATEIATLRERSAGGADLYAAQHAAWEQRRRQHEEAATTITRLDAHLAAALAKPHPDTPSPTSTELAKRLADAEAKIPGIEARLDAVNGEYDRLVCGKGACPTGTCARAEMEAVHRQQVAIRTELEQAQAACHALQAQRHQAELAENALSSMLAFERQLQRNLDEAQARLDALPAPGEEPQASATDPRIAEMEKRQAEVAALGRESAATRSAYESWERGQAAVDELRAKLAKLEDEVLRWEAVFVCVGPRGIKSKLMAERLVEMAGQVSDLLNEYFDARFRIVHGPWAVEVNQGDGWLPVQQVSWSWQARVSACLQIVLARCSGFPVLVVDETGADPLVRSNLLAMLDDQHDPPMQAFLISTAQTLDDAGEFMRPAVSEADAATGIFFLWVHNGRAETLTPTRHLVEEARHETESP